ncbi:MAG TPA: DUF983 domain-containing protein [Cyclobacteriaceae bacterium]|nr:DUF983 domain-containing protein [Cyclobacteriaceae bacterium]
MFAKGTKLYSILHEKCPRCQEGNMFAYGMLSPKFSVMNKQCAVCGLDFMPEPAYYFGAMYFSYANQVAVIVGVYLLLRYTADPGLWTYAIWVLVASIVILPWNFRFSRLAWINLFFSYKGSA